MFDSPQPNPPPGLLDLPQSDSSGSGSGASTPPLWRTAPTVSSADVYRSLSPASKTQAILRGQRELMELVRNLPESSYELSLKDLVDLPQPRIVCEEEKRPSVNGDRVTEGHGRRSRRKGYGYGNIGKEQQQEELLLKMVFPVYTGAAAAAARKGGSRRQRKERSEEESPAAVEKEWWRKRDGDSESGDSSMIGGSGSSSESSRSNSANSNSNCNSIVAVR